MPVVFEQYMDHGQIKGIVRTRPKHEKIVRFARRYVRPNIYNGQLATVFHSSGQIVYFLDIDRFENVSTLQDDMARVF